MYTILWIIGIIILAIAIITPFNIIIGGALSFVMILAGCVLYKKRQK